MGLAVHNKGFPSVVDAGDRYSKFNDADYLAYMCHEIGTPLTAIVGLSHILANMECSVERKQECAVMLNESSSMLMGMLKNMLDSSKLDAGMIKIENTEFSLATIVREAAHMMQLRVEEKGIALFVHLGQAPESMMGDPIRIQQIILNLLSNAIKFTNVGYVRLDVQALPAVGEGWQVRIAVTDTGIGISPQQANRIFDKYKQADSSTNRHYGGTGLGLTISRELAQLMQGDIHVESTLGMDSCFTALLCCHQWR